MLMLLQTKLSLRLLIFRQFTSTIINYYMLESASVMIAFETIEFCIIGLYERNFDNSVSVVALLFGTIILRI